MHDLFAMFRDLPRARPWPLAGRLQAIRRQVDDTRRRAFANVARQRAAVDAVRQKLERRRRAATPTRRP